MSNVPSAISHQPAATTDRGEKASALFKTTEIYAWIIVSLAILIGSVVLDKVDDGQRFGAETGRPDVAVATVR